MASTSVCFLGLHKTLGGGLAAATDIWEPPNPGPSTQPATPLDLTPPLPWGTVLEPQQSKRGIPGCSDQRLQPPLTARSPCSSGEPAWEGGGREHLGHSGCPRAQSREAQGHPVARTGPWWFFGGRLLVTRAPSGLGPLGDSRPCPPKLSRRGDRSGEEEGGFPRSLHRGKAWTGLAVTPAPPSHHGSPGFAQGASAR